MKPLFLLLAFAALACVPSCRSTKTTMPDGTVIEEKGIDRESFVAGATATSDLARVLAAQKYSGK